MTFGRRLGAHSTRLRCKGHWTWHDTAPVDNCHSDTSDSKDSHWSCPRLVIWIWGVAILNIHDSSRSGWLFRGHIHDDGLASKSTKFMYKDSCIVRLSWHNSQPSKIDMLCPHWHENYRAYPLDRMPLPMHQKWSFTSLGWCYAWRDEWSQRHIRSEFLTTRWALELWK